MDMPILILPPRHTPDAQAIRSAALRAGWKVEQFTSWRAPSWLRGHDLIFYGEPLFADVVTPALGLALLEPAFDWPATLTRTYRQRDIQVMTLDEVKRYPGPAFIKPAEDKSFPAGVYADGTSLPAGVHALPDVTPVLLAEPVQWEVEFRCFVLDRTVTTLSPYLREGTLAQADDGSWPVSRSEREEALAYVATLLADGNVHLPAAVVVDVGRIAGRGWAVVEANAAWGSGIYGCDPAQVLPVLARASTQHDAISREDRDWIRKHYDVEPAP